MDIKPNILETYNVEDRWTYFYNVVQEVVSLGIKLQTLLAFLQLKQSLSRVVLYFT